MDIENLVFSGGGLKGIAYVGCIKALEEYDIIPNIKCISATSIGAIFAYGMLLGYSSYQLQELLNKIDLHYFKDINVDNILNFPVNFGIDSGNKIERVLQIVTKKQGYIPDITFQQLYERTQIKFIVIGSCINKQEKTVFSYETFPNLSVIKALRISSSVPFLYNAVKLDGNTYVDGCLFENSPISYFTNNKETLNKTMGFYLFNSAHSYENKLSDYIVNLYGCLANTITNIQIKDYYDYFVKLDVSLENTMDLTKEEKMKLTLIGYEKTKEFLDSRILSSVTPLSDNELELKKEEEIKKIETSSFSNLTDEINDILTITEDIEICGK